MNNIVQRRIAATGSYTALSATPLIGTFDISCEPGNAAAINFLGDDGVSDVPWQPGEWHHFEHIDLSTIKIKGTVGDYVTVVGGTW